MKKVYIAPAMKQISVARDNMICTSTVGVGEAYNSTFQAKSLRGRRSREVFDEDDL